MKTLYGFLLMGAMLATACVTGSSPAQADDGYRGPDGHRYPRADRTRVQTAVGQCPEGEIYYRRPDGSMVSQRQLEFEQSLRARIQDQPLYQGSWQESQVPCRHR